MGANRVLVGKGAREVRSIVWQPEAALSPHPFNARAFASLGGHP